MSFSDQLEFSIEYSGQLPVNLFTEIIFTFQDFQWVDRLPSCLVIKSVESLIVWNYIISHLYCLTFSEMDEKCESQMNVSL